MSFLQLCANGNLEGIKSALKTRRKRRARVQQRDNHNWTCLHHAVVSESVECIEYLVSIKELDTAAETFEGETALHIACRFENVSLDIVTTLLKANPDLVNFVTNEGVNLLHCAIRTGRLDIVQVLVANGCNTNYTDSDGDTSLHIAAFYEKLDIVRYLLYHTECDQMIRNESEKLACTILFGKLLAKLHRFPSLLPDEILCFEELARFTFDLVDVNNTKGMIFTDLNEMIFYCYHYKVWNFQLYAAILQFFYVPPSKRYFVDKVLASKVLPCHCLIIGLLQDINNTDHFYSISSNLIASDDSAAHILWKQFLVEMYTLFLADESFFAEYVSEFMSVGWTLATQCQGSDQIEPLCEYIRESGGSFEAQKLFNFFKTLVLFDFNVFFRCSRLRQMSTEMMAVFMALINIGGTDQIIGCKRWKNLNHGMISLKEFCRKSLRQHYFENYSHYDALKALYSLNAPREIRNFVCYNPINFNF